MFNVSSLVFDHREVPKLLWFENLAITGKKHAASFETLNPKLTMSTFLDNLQKVSPGTDLISINKFCNL